MKIKHLNTALSLVSAFFFTAGLSANDGREFNIRREANNPEGRLLTAEDVVLNRQLTPWYKRGVFGDKASQAYPKAYSADASMYVVRAAGDTVCVARGGDGIVYGESVSRHEFGIDGGIFFSPDSSRVAFYRKDESKVSLFPLLDIAAPGGALKAIRYPMAGGASETVNLIVYDISSAQSITLATDGEMGDNQYLTNVTWSPDSKTIYIQLLDRAQQNVHLNAYDAASGAKLRTLLTEHSDTWVEPSYPLYWINGSASRALYCTDNRDGFWNLYLLDCNTGAIERLCDVDNDMEYVANDGKYVYFTAPDVHPVNNYLWRVSLGKKRKVEQLTREVGWHMIEMSPDCKQYLDVYQSLTQAPVSYLKTTDGRKCEVLAPAVDPTEGWAYTEIDMGTVTSANGRDLNYYRLIKPLNFDPSKKYPLILYVYGGPHSQMVNNTFMGNLRRWEMLMAQKGYVVFVIDNRGTQRHGAAYEHAIYRQCGQCEMQDQIQAMNMLMDIPWIDRDRIGVYGWSYGGFMSISLATNYPDIFKVAVAGGPVIDWQWYEVMYGERYMSTPQANPEGFAKTSLIAKAPELKSKLLVIEGGNDDTVVPHHALSFLQACIDAGVPVDYFTYPKAGHNMRGTDRVHLVEKITQYFVDNL